MINTVRNVAYKAFGLRIVSEIPLPELPQMSEQKDMADITIEIADLSGQWRKYTAEQQQRFVVEENVVMFQVPHTAIFSIQEGKKIIFSPILGAEEDKIRLYILGTCMGALLMQRKILPLHGSAIAIDGKAYALVGDSGAGKSTLASAFLCKGYQLLSDDVIAVSLSYENSPFVMPSYPQQKLWQESLNEFGMETTHYRPLFERETKYAVPVSSQFFADPLPLAGVIELVKTENESIKILRTEGLERLYTLFRHTFRNFLIPRLGLMEWHFANSANMVNKIDMFQLQRPTSRFTAHELVSLILSSLNKGGI
ncbi:aldolase [Bacillus sp. GB_SG_008]|uniref:aldolase n=1 Tax=Bacillus sp. GB_SG_008 TaxID=3454627 RepID=UPI003F87B5DC